MHILLIPDSFKDSISATDIVKELALGFSESNNQITTESCIASDGGEGFLDFVKRYIDVEIISVQTVDSLGREIVADYAFAKASNTAYIELARASGLELLSLNERDPMKSSTYGTGLQLKDAIEKGASNIYIGLGGSATNDGGIGMANALGYEFLSKENELLQPNGAMLDQIHSIRKPNNLKLPNIYAVNDVDNILTGKYGAAYIYGKQKGANFNEIKELDNGLENLSQIVLNDLKKDCKHLSGSGAAGGSGYGLKVFFDAKYITGVSFLAELSGVEQKLKEGTVDLIITGEGSLDSQTLRGKLVKGIGLLGHSYKIPVVAICGVNQIDLEKTKSLHLVKVYAISDYAISKKDSFDNAAVHIRNIAHLIDKEKGGYKQL